MYFNDTSISKAEITRRTGLSKNTITKIFENNGITLKDARTRKVDITDQELCDMYVNNPGISVNEIARRTGLSDTPIRKALKDNGIKVTTRTNLTKEETDRVVSIYYEEKDVKSTKALIEYLAEEFDVRPRAIYKLLKRKGITVTYEIKNTWTREQELIVCKMFKQGTSIKDILIQVSLSFESVRSILYKNGLNNKQRILTQEESLEMATRYLKDREEGLGYLSIVDLAIDYNVSTSAVLNHLRKHGIEITKSRVGKTIYTKSTKETVIKYFTVFKLPLQEIVWAFNLTEANVLTILSEEGIKVKINKVQTLDSNYTKTIRLWLKLRTIDRISKILKLTRAQTSLFVMQGVDNNVISNNKRFKSMVLHFIKHDSRGLPHTRVTKIRRTYHPGKISGTCAICKQFSDNLDIDHRHESKRSSSLGPVRDMLCSNCNTGIGLFKENESLIRKAINYL